LVITRALGDTKLNLNDVDGDHPPSADPKKINEDCRFPFRPLLILFICGLLAALWYALSVNSDLDSQHEASLAVSELSFGGTSGHEPPLTSSSLTPRLPPPPAVQAARTEASGWSTLDPSDPLLKMYSDFVGRISSRGLPGRRAG